MYKNNDQHFINKLHRSQRFTRLHTPYLKLNCTISTYLTDYFNVHKLNSADDCLRAFQKHKLTALHSCYRLVNTVQPAHQRSHNTQRYTASTSQYRRNTQAATHKILLRSSKRTRRINTQNSLFDSHIALTYKHTKHCTIYTFSLSFAL